jgi:hypothetical protein
MDVKLKEMRAEMLAKMETNQERIEANNEKFDILESTLVSRMDEYHSMTS